MDRLDSKGTPGERLLEGLLAGLIDAVVVIDVQGVVLRASASVETHFGWAPENLTGQNVSVLVPEPHCSRHDEYLERYRRTGKTWILGTVREFDVVHRSGRLVPCELSVSRIDLPGQVAPVFCGTFRDVTDRRQARAALARSESKFRAIFENENQFVLLLDRGNRVVDVNEPTFERTGISPDLLIGCELPEVRFWTDRPGNRDAVRRALGRAAEVGIATTRVEVQSLRHKGAEGRPAAFEACPHELSVRVVDHPDPTLLHAIVEIRDISELVNSERRESAVLRSLARVGEEAAVLVHELRSPVSSLELALKAVARQLGEEESSILDDLARRMRRLESLLQRTLRFSRPLALEPTAVDVREALGTALSREATALKKHRIQSTIHVADATESVLADPRALDDVLSNLLRNAAEAQPMGGRVELHAANSSRVGRVLITIEDMGPGVPVEDREKVFRVFHSTKDDGTGFGLAMVRSIAEEHGASVTLETGLDGAGLRVVLDWPAATPNR